MFTPILLYGQPKECCNKEYRAYDKLQRPVPNCKAALVAIRNLKRYSDKQQHARTKRYGVEYVYSSI